MENKGKPDDPQGPPRPRSSAKGADRELNLKGTICPYNFIKTKLALEEMRVGQALRVIVDFPSAVQDVPHGLELEGQKILKVNQVNDTDWEIVVLKEKD